MGGIWHHGSVQHRVLPIQLILDLVESYGQAFSMCLISRNPPGTDRQCRDGREAWERQAQREHVRCSLVCLRQPCLGQPEHGWRVR